jgi:hypothetical protein
MTAPPWVAMVRCERNSLLSDLAIRQPFGGPLGDLQFLGG